VTDFARLLAVLAGSGVEFIIIGGFAATAHGSAHVTVDLDLVYERSTQRCPIRALKATGRIGVVSIHHIV
jgi:hypothetical protein